VSATQFASAVTSRNKVGPCCLVWLVAATTNGVASRNALISGHSVPGAVLRGDKEGRGHAPQSQVWPPLAPQIKFLVGAFGQMG